MCYFMVKCFAFSRQVADERCDEYTFIVSKCLILITCACVSKKGKATKLSLSENV